MYTNYSKINISEETIPQIYTICKEVTYNTNASLYTKKFAVWGAFATQNRCAIQDTEEPEIYV